MYRITFKESKLALASSLVLIIISCHVRSLAQDARIVDSLTNVLAKSGNDAERCDIFFILAGQFKASNGKISLEYAEKGFELAIASGDSLRIVKGARIKGQVYRSLDNLPESINAFRAGQAIAERNKVNRDIRHEYKNILNGMAITYTYIADYDKALEYNFKSLMLHEEDGNKGDISIVLNNIGLVYFKLKNFVNALDYYEKSYQYKMESKDYFDLDRLLINTGLCYNQVGDFDQALAKFHEAFNVCNGNCSSQIQIEGEYGLGVSYYGLKDYKMARKHLSSSYNMADEIGDKRFQAENLIIMSHVLVSLNNLEEGLESLKKVEKIATVSGFNEVLIECFKQYADIYTRQADFPKASLYQSKYITLKDSIYSGELIDRIAKIQTQFQERVNLQTIAAKEETIERQRLLNIAIAIIALLATALIFVLRHSINVKRKVNADLSDAKAIIEDQNRQLMSSNVSLNQELKEKNIDLQKANDSLQRVNEELDNFIYKTSHDIRGPLASLKGMCNVALMDVKDPLALSYLQKLDITAEKLNTILTRLLIVNQINNSTTGAGPIDFESIVDDILTLERKKGLPRRLTITKKICTDIEFQSDKEFVRIILENLIDNAIKFYNDSERVTPFVDIAIHAHEEYISINVVDNGIGISEVHPDKIFQMFSRASERSETGGIGLFITKTAAEKLGGSVHLKTTPEGYTEFYVKLPVTHTRVVEPQMGEV